MKTIYVAGMPSYFGGADTELLHNIELWRMHDVEVNLVPMFGCDPQMQKQIEKIGCRIHAYRPDIFKDKIVVSYCNGAFLSKLPEIMDKGKPAEVIWFNCMTWCFDAEKTAHRNGWLTQHGYVSNYQRAWVKTELEQIAPVNDFGDYRPYFNPDNKAQQIEFNYREPEDFFAVGRISRDDPNKFSTDMWRIFDRVLTPKHKKVFILGFSGNVHKKVGPAPQGLDWQLWKPNEVPVKQIYNILHAIIHKTGGSRESYCRIVPEAYAFGVPIITEDDYAFPDLIINGVTGFRCKTSDEMSYRASELAFDEERRKKMIYAAREHLVNEIANPAKCWAVWSKLFNGAIL